MDDIRDLVDHGDYDYDEVSQAVRHHAAQRILGMIESLQPAVSQLFREPGSLEFLEPARIAVQTQVYKLYLQAVKDLGDLYRVKYAPVVPEPEVPMIPAADVPLMIESAVATAVELAVLEVEQRLASEKEERVRIKASQARASLETALARIKGRSS
jgi:hypothetical protein